MKKIIKSLCLFAMCLLLSSCVKYDATIKVNTDNSVDFSFISAIKKEYAESMSDSQDYSKYKEEGYIVEPYSDKEYEGYKIYKHYTSLDEVSSTDLDHSTLTDNDDKLFKVKKGFLKNTYYAKLESNESKDMTEKASMYESDDEFSDQASELLKSFDMKFNLELPIAAISSNATTVSSDGLKLQWDLTNMKDPYIEFTFQTINYNNLLLLIGIILIIGSISFFVIKHMMGTKHRLYMFTDRLKNRSAKK